MWFNCKGRDSTFIYMNVTLKLKGKRKKMTYGMHTQIQCNFIARFKLMSVILPELWRKLSHEITLYVFVKHLPLCLRVSIFYPLLGRHYFDF